MHLGGDWIIVACLVAFELEKAEPFWNFDWWSWTQVKGVTWIVCLVSMFGGRIWIKFLIIPFSMMTTELMETYKWVMPQFIFNLCLLYFDANGPLFGAKKGPSGRRINCEDSRCRCHQHLPELNLPVEKEIHLQAQYQSQALESTSLPSQHKSSPLYVYEKFWTPPASASSNMHRRAEQKIQNQKN